MRIVTWNCGMALDRKAPNLLRLIRTLRSFRSVRRNPWMFSTATVSPACGSVPIQNKGLAVLCRRFALQAVGKRQVGDSRSGSWCVTGFQLAGGLGLPDRDSRRRPADDETERHRPYRLEWIFGYKDPKGCITKFNDSQANTNSAADESTKCKPNSNRNRMLLSKALTVSSPVN